MALEWVSDDAFHMPELPAELKVDPLLAALLHMACFMEFSGESTVDLDESVSAMGAMGYYLQRLPPERVKDIEEQLRRVVAFGKRNRWKKGVLEFVARFLRNAGVGE